MATEQRYAIEDITSLCITLYAIEDIISLCITLCQVHSNWYCGGGTPLLITVSYS